MARQIAAVAQDLAGLRAEERRLLHARAQPQQGVRRIATMITPRCRSPNLVLY